jgi:NADH-quinone oxidoreductase subunit N
VIHTLLQALPMAVVFVGAVVIMLLSRSRSLSLDRLNLIAVAFLGTAFLLELPRLGNTGSLFWWPGVFGRSFILDDFATLFDLMFTAGALLTLLINTDYFRRRRYYNGEYFALILLSVFGMMLLAHANELVSAFISLEIASLSIYALVGYHKNNLISSEAMMKYLVLGSMTGVFFMLGTALIYGASGTTDLTGIAAFIHRADANEMAMVIAGGTFIMVPILFKIGAVPFHSWVVDVYHGAPYPVTMFIASTFKIAIFAIALRLYLVDFAAVQTVWTPVLQIVTVLTLLGGSWLAITQNIVKRMLAGSSIVHGGYLLIAFTSSGLGSPAAAASIMFYLIAYFLSAAGAFGVLSFIASDSRTQMTYDDFKGFADRRPYLALVMAVFMLSLSGFPSTIGFLGKFYIFTGAIESGQLLLAGLGVLTAFISVYYYFRLIAVMYFYPGEGASQKLRVNLSSILIVLMALLIIWGGIGTSLIPFVPGADGFIDMAEKAVASLHLPGGP